MTTSAPRPGRISGVGALVDNVCSVGVADGGNQTIVDVGGGVSVTGMGVDVASHTSMAEQEVNTVMARRDIARRSNPRNRWRLLCRFAPRNDIGKGLKVTGIL